MYFRENDKPVENFDMGEEVMGEAVPPMPFVKERKPQIWFYLILATLLIGSGYMVYKHMNRRKEVKIYRGY